LTVYCAALEELCVPTPLTCGRREPFAEADELRVQWGWNELEEKSTPKWVTYLHMVRAR
jgi:hypothetical protein